MKKLGMLILALAATGLAQTQPAPAQAAPQKGHTSNLSIGNAPTPADMYCSGFITTDHVPENRFVAAGWNSPDQTRYAGSADIVYIHGKDMKEGDRFQMVRHVKDPNHYELFRGQQSAIRNAGQPYFELGYVRVIDVQKDTAIAVPELSCADIVPGDLAIPFEERQAPHFKKVTIDRFAPPNGKTTGRIIMANEFDSFVGTKYKVYLNIGADKGLKPGDYLRATRTYSYTYHDPEAGMSLKASAREDTQKGEPRFSTSELSTLPRRTLGDMIVLQVHKKSATAMVLTALEDIHVGDGVEVMDVTDAPEVQPVKPVSATQPSAVVPPAAAPATSNAEAQPPRINCTATPATIRVGESATISCDATSPDNHPISIAFVANGGRLSANRNQATLDASETAPGIVAVRATAIDDRQLNATAVTNVNIEAATPPPPAAQHLSELQFKPNSAYVDNRSKAILDDVALKLQQDPTATVVLTGSVEEKEAAPLANQRAQNAMDYLTKSKGIDGQRIQTKAGTDAGRKVDITALPAGASAPGPEQQPTKQE